VFILFIVLILVSIALVVAGVVNIVRTPRPLAYVAVLGGVILGAAGLLLLLTVL
jgi:hypothetical protein